MSVTGSSEDPPGGAGPGPQSRLRRLVHFYTSPGDRTPTSVGVVIGLLATTGLVVLGPTSQWWFLACAGLLVYAIAGLVRPVEAWRVLCGAGDPSSSGGAATLDPSGTPDPSGWLPTRQFGPR